jgi:hypothetical protein
MHIKIKYALACVDKLNIYIYLYIKNKNNYDEDILKLKIDKLCLLLLIKVKNTMSYPKWMMDSEFELDDYEYYTENEKDDNDYIPFNEYRNDVLYDVHHIHYVYNFEYDEISNNSIDY